MKKIQLIMIALICMLVVPCVYVEAGITPTGDVANFFANGIPITIGATQPEGASLATVAGFTATGTSAYISWTIGNETYYIGVANNVWIFGGADGNSTPVEVENTNITMTGGSIRRIYGGNRGADNTVAGVTLQDASVVTGDVTINVTGGTIGWDIYGGGLRNAAVEGKVSITVNGATIADGVYIAPGSQGNGKEGYNNYETKEVVTNAIVETAEVVFANNTLEGIVYVFAGPSGGHTKVVNSTLTIGDGQGTNDTPATCVVAGGVNGHTSSSTIVLNSDANVTDYISANRGYIGSAELTVNGAHIENLYSGATPGCFTSDGIVSASVNGEYSIILEDASGIQNAFITPQIVKVNEDSYLMRVGQLVVINNDDENEVEFKINKFDTGSAVVGREISEISIESSDVVTMGENVKLTIAPNVNLRNKGELNIIGKFTSNGTLTNTGTVHFAGVAENNGDITNDDGSIVIIGSLTNKALGTLTNTGTISTEATGTYTTNGTEEGDVVKKVTEGAGQTYAGESEGLTITANGVLGGEEADFTEGVGKIYIDDEEVSPDNYTLTSGSIIVTFKKAFLATLDNGEHIVSIVYDNGSYAEAEFETNIETPPPTFDNVMIYIVMGVICAVGIAVMLIFGKKKAFKA